MLDTIGKMLGLDGPMVLPEVKLKPKEAPPSAAAKVYDGSRVVAHVVKQGETLSRIAKVYGFKSWQPVWKYNSLVHHTVGDDPDSVRDGVSILIPRNAAGYAALVKQLAQTKREAELLTDKIVYELEADKNLLEANKVILDLWSDIGTSLVTLGANLAGAAKASKAVEVAKGQAKIAQHMSANAISREFAEKFTKVQLKRLKTSMDAATKFAEKTKSVNSAPAKKLIGGLAELADRKVKDSQGSDDGAWFKAAYKGMISAEKAQKALKLVKTGDKVIDVLGILLDYAKPSKVAEAALWLSTGEGAATSQAEAIKKAKLSGARGSERLDALIGKYKAEAKLLYG